jgi:hypothetical protein
LVLMIESFVKYTIEMATYGISYVPGLMKIGSGIEVII